MISRRALFAGAAGAVVAASPVGKALAASGAPDLSMVRRGNRIISLEEMAEGILVTVRQNRSDAIMYGESPLFRANWLTRAEALEMYPNAD